MARGRKSRSRTNADGPSSDGAPVADDRVRKEVPEVSEDARSRASAGKRFDGWREYAQFAVDAGSDIFDGEPIERFAAVGKHDDRALRMRAQDFREQQFAFDVEMAGKRLAKTAEPEQIEAPK